MTQEKCSEAESFYFSECGPQIFGALFPVQTKNVNATNSGLGRTDAYESESYFYSDTFDFFDLLYEIIFLSKFRTNIVLICLLDSFELCSFTAFAAKITTSNREAPPGESIHINMFLW